MTTAEHILQWALNSQEHYHAIKALQKLHDTIGVTAAPSALKLATDVSVAMRKAGDLTPWDRTANALLAAAVLMLEHNFGE